MINPNNDGVDHINIYSKGKTRLGRFLSHFHKMPIELETYGYFESIEGLWYFLKYGDESLRYLSGVEAKHFGQKLEKKLDPLMDSTSDEFRAIIMKANIQKLNLSPEMLNQFLESSYKFDHYYVRQYSIDLEPVITELPRYEWITNFWNLLRHNINKYGIEYYNQDKIINYVLDREHKKETSMALSNDPQIDLF